MEIIALRKWYTNNTTIGELTVDSVPGLLLYVMEPTTRVGVDPRGIVAIPEGRYEITLYNSPRFNMKVPLLGNVPGHDYVEIHPGNFEMDTHDCLLPGTTYGLDYVGNSRDAFEQIFPLIDQELNTKQCWITVKNTGS